MPHLEKASELVECPLCCQISVIERGCYTVKANEFCIHHVKYASQLFHYFTFTFLGGTELLNPKESGHLLVGSEYLAKAPCES